MPVDTVDILLLNNFEIKLSIKYNGLSINNEQILTLLYTENHLLTNVIETC